MGCLGNSKTEDQRNEDKAQREANKKIEKQLQKDKQIYRATHRLLLLGKFCTISSYVFTLSTVSICFVGLHCIHVKLMSWLIQMAGLTLHYLF